MADFWDRKQDRREFFRGIMRYSILGGLVLSAGTLIRRRRNSASAEDETIDVSVCRSCTFLRKCDQPIALLAKRISGGRLKPLEKA